ncbi:MAG: UDP-2,3-diacylglucosamine diphosphatase [Gemmatimonadales bacterium]
MPDSRLVIVSDAHLGAAPPESDRALETFLEAVPDLGDALLVNGDLFDFWFAYRRAIPRSGARVLALLGTLARRMPVAMTGGNHDRWGDSFWERDLGIRWSAGELRWDAAGLAVLALHGDGIAEVHWQARVMHRVTRHRLTAAAYRLIHPDLGIWLVNRLSGVLGDNTRDPAVLDRAAARQVAWAEERLRRSPEIGLLVMGHTHRPTVVEAAPGRRYVNPGAWMDGLRYAVATRDGVELRQFPG